VQTDLITRAEVYVSELLRNHLPVEISFHNLEHTRDVVEAACILSTAHGLPAESREILALAAWFHDTGLTSTYSGHETSSARIARDKLGEWGYAESQIEIVTRCILATRLPQEPQSLLESILCDADLFHLSVGQYWEKAELLKTENFAVHGEMPEEKWYLKNLNFLVRHTYLTPYGKQFLEPGKRENIYKNLKKLETLILTP